MRKRDVLTESNLKKKSKQSPHEIALNFVVLLIIILSFWRNTSQCEMFVTLTNCRNVARSVHNGSE